MEKLKLAAGMTGEQKRYAVEAALLLGFQTETATFPVITADGEIPVPENMEELKALWKKSTGGTPEEYESASKHTGPIFDLDFRKEKGLETMLQKGDFLKDENQDLLPDVLDVKIVLPEDADDAMLVAACNLAWRFGMETTGYKGTITADAAYTGNRLVLEKAEQTELVREKEGESVRVIGQNVLMANPSHQTFYPHYVSRSKQLHHPRLKDSFPIDSSHSFADK